MGNYILKDTHIDEVGVGDTVVHGGHLRTVCKNNIKVGGFMGTTLFGDSYRSGRVPVKVAHFIRPERPQALE